MNAKDTPLLDGFLVRGLLDSRGPKGLFDLPGELSIFQWRRDPIIRKRQRACWTWRGNDKARGLTVIGKTRAGAIALWREQSMRMGKSFNFELMQVYRVKVAE